MSYAGDILKEVKEKTPKYGFNVCLFDDYEDVGEKLVILAHVDTAQEADEIAEEYKDQTIYIYEGTEEANEYDISQQKGHNIDTYIDKAGDDFDKGKNSPNDEYEKLNEAKVKGSEGSYDIQPMLHDMVNKALGKEDKKKKDDDDKPSEFTLDGLLKEVAKILAGKAGKKLGIESKAKANEDSSYLKHFTYNYSMIFQGPPSAQYIHTIKCKICGEYINNNHGWDDPEPLCKSHLLQHDMVYESKANEVSVYNMSDKELNDEIYQFDKYSGGGDEYYEQELRDEAWKRKSKKIQAFNKAQQEAGTNEPYVVDMMSKSSTEGIYGQYDDYGEFWEGNADLPLNEINEDLAKWEKEHSGWSNIEREDYIEKLVLNDYGRDVDGYGRNMLRVLAGESIANEGGRGSGKHGHQPWMLDAEGTQCEGCGMLTYKNDDGNCDICGA